MKSNATLWRVGCLREGGRSNGGKNDLVDVWGGERVDGVPQQHYTDCNGGKGKWLGQLNSNTHRFLGNRCWRCSVFLVFVGGRLCATGLDSVKRSKSDRMRSE